MTDSDAEANGSDSMHVGPLNWAVVIVALVAAGVGGYHIVTAVATSPELQAYVAQSAEWCNSRGGELVNSQTIGEHGGLHCDLPNGPSVHMSDVAASGYPEAAEDVESNVDGPWWSVGATPLLLISFGVAAVAVVASGIRQWRKT